MVCGGRYKRNRSEVCKELSGQQYVRGAQRQKKNLLSEAGQCPF